MGANGVEYLTAQLIHTLAFGEDGVPQRTRCVAAFWRLFDREYDLFQSPLLRFLELLSRDPQVTKNGADGARSEIFAAPVGNSRSGMRRDTNPYLVISLGPAIEFTVQMAQLPS